MALDTFEDIAGRVNLRCPSAGILLCRDWVRNAFRELNEKRLWSWNTRRDQIVFAAAYTTGTVTVTHNSNTVTGASTVWTTAMEGRQFRSGSSNPLYTIQDVASATSLTLDKVWGGSTASGSTYEIFNAYYTVPADFFSWISVWDPNFNWQLHLHVSQEEINAVDAQRSNEGTSYVVADLDYYAGTTDAAISPARPRYEIWPHRKSQYVLPYLYHIRPDDLDDSTGELPRSVPGNYLLEMALAEAATWPGTETRRNPYSSQWRAQRHEEKAAKLIMELERQDNEIFEREIAYSMPQSFAPYPFYDANWMMDHDFSFL